MNVIIWILDHVQPIMFHTLQFGVSAAIALSSSIVLSPKISSRMFIAVSSTATSLSIVRVPP